MEQDNNEVTQESDEAMKEGEGDRQGEGGICLYQIKTIGTCW
jgi:hypothetical protein